MAFVQPIERNFRFLIICYRPYDIDFSRCVPSYNEGLYRHSLNCPDVFCTFKILSY
jgi:hypothetical protein